MKGPGEGGRMTKRLRARLTEEQKAQLAKRAHREGISEAELARRLIREAAGRKQQGRRE
jgi:predicted HicB family RNase H-like nuclease